MCARILLGSEKAVLFLLIWEFSVSWHQIDVAIVAYSYEQIGVQ